MSKEMPARGQQLFLANNELRNRLEHCTNLPSPPGVATRIIELSLDPNVSLNDVAAAVRVDPALTTKILRIANSAFYARRRKIDNLHQAIMMFGLNGTLTLALSFSLVKSLCGTDGKGMDYNLFWRRSLAAAIACRSIGSRLQLGSKEDLFLTGLIQDIGMLALDQFVPDLYQEIGPQQGDHLHVQNVERETLSTDHAAVGAWLLQRWNLPERWVQAVAGSHDFPEYNIDPKYEQLARCVMLSGATADIVYHENRELASFRARKQAQRLLGLNRETLVSVLNEMVPELQGTAAFFDVYLMDSAFVDSILDRAQEILNLRNL